MSLIYGNNYVDYVFADKLQFIFLNLKINQYKQNLKSRKSFGEYNNHLRITNISLRQDNLHYNNIDRSLFSLSQLYFSPSSFFLFEYGLF